MAQRLLLDVVQDILAAIDGEEVNSITDTVEAEQVARIVRKTFYHIIPTLDLKSHYGFFNLTASGDSAKPVLMTVPTTTVDISWIKYDKKLTAPANSLYEHIYWLDIDRFMDLTLAMNTDETNVSSMTHSNFLYKYRTDRHPTYFTSANDSELIFDAYYSTLDTTLQSSKTYCYGQLDSSFTLDDSFTIDLDKEVFSLLYNEAEAQSFEQVKQVQSSSASARARKAWIRSQQDASDTPNLSDYDQMPDYGRK